MDESNAYGAALFMGAYYSSHADHIGSSVDVATGDGTHPQRRGSCKGGTSPQRCDGPTDHHGAGGILRAIESCGAGTRKAYRQRNPAGWRFGSVDAANECF